MNISKQSAFYREKPNKSKVSAILKWKKYKLCCKGKQDDADFVNSINLLDNYKLIQKGSENIGQMGCKPCWLMGY